MTDERKPYDLIVDFVTGKTVPEIGSEANRQQVERLLVEDKGYLKEDIEVDVDIVIDIAGTRYGSAVDLVVSVNKKRVIAIKCAAASLGSREREILSASRLLEPYQMPLSVVSDGQTAIVMDTVTGKKLGEGLNAIPTKTDMENRLVGMALVPLSEKRMEKEKLIFRSYDSMNVNVQRNFQSPP